MLLYCARMLRSCRRATSMAAYAAGYLVFLRDQTLIAQPFDLRRLELTGEAGSHRR